MICKQCGAQLPEGSAFCGACGAAVEKPGFCVRCGAPLQEGAAFCGACGADQNPAPQPPKPKKKTARWLAAAAAVLAVCVGAFFLLKNMHGTNRIAAADTPQEALEQYYEAAVKGDAHSAYAAAGIDLDAYAYEMAQERFDSYEIHNIASTTTIESVIEDYRVELTESLRSILDYQEVLDEIDGEEAKINKLLARAEKMETEKDVIACMQEERIISADFSCYGTTYWLDRSEFNDAMRGGTIPISVEEFYELAEDNLDYDFDYMLNGDICRYSYNDVEEAVTFRESDGLMAIKTAEGWFFSIFIFY